MIITRLTYNDSEDSKSEMRVSHLSVEKFVEQIKKEQKGNFLTKFREAQPFLRGKPEWFTYIKKISRICATSELKKNKSGAVRVEKYNGIVLLEVDNLKNQHEVATVKHEAARLPQTLAAFMGSNGLSVKIWVLASLPDGELPTTEEAAQLFHASAYQAAYWCYTPSLSYPITITAPKLDASCRWTLDEKPYFNPKAVPFIIDQPTVMPEDTLLKSQLDGSLPEISGEPDNYITCAQIFSAAHANALHQLDAHRYGQDDIALIDAIARNCALGGLAEEETAMRLQMMFFSHDNDEVRASVRNIYEMVKPSGIKRNMPKKQEVALRLRHFLDRRYELRYNEVMQQTEFRSRFSLRLMPQMLTERDINTMLHEANSEGIAASSGDINVLLNSNYIPRYNPIEEFLNKLPAWDGKDHIGTLSGMVKCDNPHWPRLFYRWFLSMVAHWMNYDSEHSNNTAPILIGDQGYRKSTFCRIILPPMLRGYYTDSLDLRSNTEAERYICRFMLINLDEYDQLSDKNAAYVKHLFQKPSANIRRMYTNTIETMRRYASFIGTTNNSSLLSDPTGSRRYICVRLTEPIHTGTPINYNQLYAQAMHAINKGERYWINDEEETLIKETNRVFERTLPMEEMLLRHYRLPRTGEEEWHKAIDIYDLLTKENTFDKKRDSIVKLGTVLTKLKCEKRHLIDGNYYNLIQIS